MTVFNGWVTCTPSDELAQYGHAARDGFGDGSVCYGRGYSAAYGYGDGDGDGDGDGYGDGYGRGRGPSESECFNDIFGGEA